MADRLTDLKWNEISGVDAAANDTEGFLVQKGKELNDEAKDFEKSVIAAYESLKSEPVTKYFATTSDEVRKALATVTGAFEQGIEDDEDREKLDEDEVAKGVVARLAELFGGKPVEKAEERDEDESSGDGSGEDVEKSEEESEDETDVQKQEDEPTADPTDLAKSVAEALDAQLDPLRKAILGVVDRIENVEKATAGTQALPGQDGDGEGKQEDETSDLTKAVQSALRGNKTTLS